MNIKSKHFPWLLLKRLGSCAVLAWGALHGGSVDLPRHPFASQAQTLELDLDIERLRFLADHLNQPVGVELRWNEQTWPESQARLRMVNPTHYHQGRPEFLLEFGDFDIEGSRPVFTLHLDPSSNDGSYLEQYCGAKFAELCQLPCLKIGHAKVLLNDRDCGLYVLKEGITSAWLSDQFGLDDGLVLQGAGQDIDQPLEVAFRGKSTQPQLQEALVAACLIDDLETRNRRLGDCMNVEAFLRLMALESIYRHGNGYAEAIQSYLLYLDPHALRVLFIPDGFAQGFVGPGFPILNSKLGLAARALMQIPSRQLDYLKVVAGIANSSSVQTSLVRSLDERAPIIEFMLTGAVEKHRFLMRTQLLKSRLEARFAAVRMQLDQRATLDQHTATDHAIPGLRVRQSGQSSDLPIRSPIDYGQVFLNHYLAPQPLDCTQPVRLFEVNVIARPGILESLTWRSTNWVSAEVQIDGQRFTQTALRLKGHGTRRDFRAKASFTLKFNKESKGQTFLGQSKIHLHNALYDPSCLNEFTGAWLFHRAGYPAPQVNFAHVRVNDADYGLYVMVESTARSFLERAFGHDHGLLYEGIFGDVDAPLDLDNGNPPELDAGPSMLYQAARESLQLGRIDPLRRLCQLEPLATFVSLEVVLGHHDGYSIGRHNFRLYRDSPDAPFLFLPHGMDVLFFNADAVAIPDFKGVLAQAITQVPDGRTLYLEKCETVVRQALDLEAYAKDIAYVCRLLQPVLRAYEPLKAAAQLESARQRVSVLGDRQATLIVDLARRQRQTSRTLGQP